MNDVNGFYDLKAKDYKGKIISFKIFEGLVCLVVNVASQCGLAEKSYRDMSVLLDTFYDKGLRILLFPCNQFLSQEPDTIAKINEKVKEYSDKFILFDKIDVKGKNIHPVYKYLTSNIGGWFNDDIKWNFSKFLVDRKGNVKYRFAPVQRITNTNEYLMEAMEELSTGKPEL
ncbi:putative phospholipid hydroperoxide glutathione peroxidase [Astathelohania contejeani]|uniref:Glutathione peroxidase n=1 Tax=Astathelohania contejeani TaxID=164912 RepID=A0ABQ7HXN2_9MICR|nr:putative phospholipid hydroperoxide glutathione peroxidase [Thelohania contejeani]